MVAASLGIPEAFMKLVGAISTIVLFGTAASADVRIFNVTQSKMKVDLTLPNGSVQSDTFDPAVDAVDDGKWTLAAGVKSVKVSISDDDGTAVWSGTVGANDAGVIVPSGKGAKYVPAGTYSGGSDTWKAAVFMNVTGDAIAIDLEGRNGLGAHRGISTGPAFDLKKGIKLDPREASFSVSLKIKDTDGPVKLESTAVTPGAYYVLWKRSRDGAYRLLQTGYLPPPPKPKK